MKPFAFGNLAESLCEHCLVSYAPQGILNATKNSQNKVRPSFFRDEILQLIYPSYKISDATPTTSWTIDINMKLISLIQPVLKPSSLLW